MIPQKVSVVIPCFNVGRYIGEALTSVFAQTHPTHEVTVVDDGSTDDSASNARKVGRDRIRLIRTENHGLSAARNVGLEASTGDYIAFLDADDRWRPEMLSRGLQILESEPDVQAVFCNMVRFTDNGQYFPNDQFTYYPELDSIITRQCHCGFGRVVVGDAFTTIVGFQDIPSWSQAIIYRRSAIGDIRFIVGVKICESIDFFLQVAARGAIAFDSTPNVEIRRHGANSTTDYKKLVYAKLPAFLRLKSAVLSEVQRRALSRRTVRAALDCAVAALNDRQRSQAVHFYVQAFKVGRLGWQQIYFGLKFPLLILRSLLSRV